MSDEFGLRLSTSSAIAVGRWSCWLEAPRDARPSSGRLCVQQTCATPDRNADGTRYLVRQRRQPLRALLPCLRHSLSSSTSLRLPSGSTDLKLASCRHLRSSTKLSRFATTDKATRRGFAKQATGQDTERRETHIPRDVVYRQVRGGVGMTLSSIRCLLSSLTRAQDHHTAGDPAEKAGRQAEHPHRRTARNSRSPGPFMRLPAGAPGRRVWPRASRDTDVPYTEPDRAEEEAHTQENQRRVGLAAHEAIRRRRRHHTLGVRGQA